MVKNKTDGKWESEVLNVARKRLAGLVAIDATLDLGDSISVKTLGHAVNTLNGSVLHYNEVKSGADATKLQIGDQERALRTFLSRALNKVAGKYTEDSVEYSQAGGTKKSERKRRGERKRELDARKARNSAKREAARQAKETQAKQPVSPPHATTYSQQPAAPEAQNNGHNGTVA